MSFIRKHWFGFLIGCWFLLLSFFVAIILYAPHHDAKNRGFAYCTQELIEKIGNCENAGLCVAGAILHNTWCDIGIIKQSFVDWLDNKHPYPWSGYVFKPELPLAQSAYFDENEIREYMQKYPDTLQYMENLKQLRKDLENAQNKESSIENNSIE